MNAVVVGGDVVTPDGRRRADVRIESGRIVGIDPSPGTPPPGADEIDARGMLVAPGLVDLQCNGAGGIDLSSEPGRLWEVAALLPRWGVTSWLPTIVSSEAAVRDRAVACLGEGPPEPTRVVAEPLGLHLEGPFLDPSRRGAHEVEHLAPPDPAVAVGWSPESGIALVTLAPELPGALAVIDELRRRGVVVAAGHSSANADQATAAIDAGVTFVTHLFNAMAPLHHREPGLAGVALADPRVRVGLIVDGIHVHPLVVRLAQRLLGDRLVLVTDAVAALGAAPGRLALGRNDIVPGDDGVRRPDGTLAGSDLSLDQAVRNLVAFSGCPVEEALRAATSAPASVLGLGTKGVLTTGADADLVLLTPDLRVVRTLVGGEVSAETSGEVPWRS